MAQGQVPFDFSIDGASLHFNVDAAPAASMSTAMVSKSNEKSVEHAPPSPAEDMTQASQSPAGAATQLQRWAGELEGTETGGAAATIAQRCVTEQVDSDLACWARASLRAWLDPARIDKLISLLMEHDISNLKLLRCTAKDELRKVRRAQSQPAVAYAFDAALKCRPCQVGNPPFGGDAAPSSLFICVFLICNSCQRPHVFSHT
jgi:hypothetical protein